MNSVDSPTIWKWISFLLMLYLLFKYAGISLPNIKISFSNDRIFHFQKRKTITFKNIWMFLYHMFLYHHQRITILIHTDHTCIYCSSNPYYIRHVTHRKQKKKCKHTREFVSGILHFTFVYFLSRAKWNIHFHLNILQSFARTRCVCFDCLSSYFELAKQSTLAPKKIHSICISILCTELIFISNAIIQYSIVMAVVF